MPKTMLFVATIVSQAVLLAACGGPAGQDAAPKTAAPTSSASSTAVKPTSEALPADGGDVGKAYADLVAAYQNLDTARFNTLVENFGTPGDPLTKKDTDQLLVEMQALHPAGGVRQGTRATLFLSGDALHGTFSASLEDGHWAFDSMNPQSWKDDPRDPMPNCEISQLFPCRVQTFPDAKVAGTATVYRAAPDNSSMPASGVLLDGYGVRMIDRKTKALQFTQIVLSSEALHPVWRASDEVDNAAMGSVVLHVAADGKSTKLMYINAVPFDQHVQVDATHALVLDTTVPNRMRGHLTLDAKDLANIDVNFDVGIASACKVGESRCGN